MIAIARPARWPPSSRGRRSPTIPTAKAAYYPRLDPRPRCFPTTSPRARAIPAAPPWTLRSWRSTPHPCRRPRTLKPQPPARPSKGSAAPDGSLAMGTSFDCFDVKANTAALGLSKEERENRAVLVEAMQAHGFKNYAKEWWHFTLETEPYPGTIFDFPRILLNRARANRAPEISGGRDGRRPGLTRFRRVIRRGRRARAARGAPGPRRSRSRSAAHRDASG